MNQDPMSLKEFTKHLKEIYPHVRFEKNKDGKMMVIELAPKKK